jgi:CRP/FNR family transcriptional regulator, cyclic AMP receptor protein
MGGTIMALESNIELLGDVPIFSGLEPEQLKAIALKAKKAFFEVGANIVTAGKTGNTAYLIQSGRAVTRPPAGAKFEAEQVEAGVLVGELAMLAETIYTLDVVAEERVRALAIERDDLFAVLEADPAIAHHLSERVTERLIFLARDLREVDARFAMIEASLDEVIASIR